MRGSKDARQQAGFKTAMISEQAGEGGTRRVSTHSLPSYKVLSFSKLSQYAVTRIACAVVQVTLSLTPEIVQQLFAEKPHLHRAYTAMVPEKLSEKEFWERYFNYEVARKVHISPSTDHGALTGRCRALCCMLDLPLAFYICFELVCVYGH